MYYACDFTSGFSLLKNDTYAILHSLCLVFYEIVKLLQNAAYVLFSTLSEGK